jgi:hypothetical protein
LILGLVIIAIYVGGPALMYGGISYILSPMNLPVLLVFVPIMLVGPGAGATLYTRINNRRFLLDGLRYTLGWDQIQSLGRLGVKCTFIQEKECGVCLSINFFCIFISLLGFLVPMLLPPLGVYALIGAAIMLAVALLPLGLFLLLLRSVRKPIATLASDGVKVGRKHFTWEEVFFESFVKQHRRAGRLEMLRFASRARSDYKAEIVANDIPALEVLIAMMTSLTRRRKTQS